MTPDYKLDVAGTFGVDGAVTLGDASGDAVTVNSAAWTFANDTTVALSGGVDGINFDSNTMSIDATNNRVGVGTAAPTTMFQVGQAGNTGNITVVGTGTTCTIGSGTGFTMCTSDERLKENVADLGDDTLQKVLNLRPVNFNWNEASGHDQTQQHTGFIAQEVQTQFADSVGVVYSDAEMGDVYGVDYASLVVPTIKALQELNTKVDLNQLNTDSAISTIEQNIDDVDAHQDNLATSVQDLEDRIDSLETSQNTNQLVQGIWNGGVVTEDTEFAGKVTFSNLTKFVQTATFSSDVNFLAKINVGSDTAGSASIPAGSSVIHVAFDSAYATAPKVTASAKNFGSSSYDYVVSNITTTGFDIQINNVQTNNIEFDWIALGKAN
jgi:hypothetical protein